MKSILDRSFRYVPSAETDLRRTFARIRREQRRGRDVGPLAPVRILPLRRRKS